MTWQKHTNFFLKSGNMYGASILNAQNGQIFASSGNSLSPADCKVLYAALENGNTSEIILRGTLHKNTRPGYEYESLYYTSGKRGVVVFINSFIIAIGSYDQEQNQNSEKCSNTVKRLILEMMDSEE